MVTESDEDLDTQAFARIQADLLSPPNPTAPTETPRASSASGSVNKGLETLQEGNLRDGQARISPGRRSQQPCNLHSQPFERDSSSFTDVVASNNVLTNLATLSSHQGQNDESTAAVVKFNRKDISARRKRKLMDDAGNEIGQATSNILNDTQELPSQVYADYFNSEKISHLSHQALDRLGHTQNTAESTFQVYNAGDIGHVNLDEDTETNLPKLSHQHAAEIESHSFNHDRTGLHDTEEENESVTSPVVPSPISSAFAGQKHDRHGNIVEHRTQYPAGDDAHSPDVSTMFKVPQAKPSIGLSQVFNQTQAATSPPPPQDEARSDPIFDRPSPDFRSAARASSPFDTSPDIVRKTRPEKSTQGPRDVYVSVRQSQERRRQGVSGRTQLPEEDEDDFDILNENSVERKLAQRHRRAEIDASSRRDFASLRTPSSIKQSTSRRSRRGSTNSLVTPASRRKGVVIDISDETPLSVVAEADNEEEGLSDDVSMDEYDELSQTIVSTGRKSAKFSQHISAPQMSTSSRHSDIEDSSSQVPVPHSGIKDTTLHTNSDANGDGTVRWSHQFPSQTIRVADSQPDRNDKNRQRGPTQFDFGNVPSAVPSDSGQVVPQSQTIRLGVSGRLHVAAQPEVAETSSASASGPVLATSETEQAAAVVPASPASSPPVDRQVAKVKRSADTPKTGLEHGSIEREISPPLPRRRRLRRTIPDTSPPRSEDHQVNPSPGADVPSASLPNTRMNQDQTSSRSLARSNSTTTYETAKTHQSLPNTKSLVQERSTSSTSHTHQEVPHITESAIVSSDKIAGGTVLDILADQARDLPPEDTGSSQENRPPETQGSKTGSQGLPSLNEKSRGPAKPVRKPFTDSSSDKGVVFISQAEGQIVSNPDVYRHDRREEGNADKYPIVEKQKDANPIGMLQNGGASVAENVDTRLASVAEAHLTPGADDLAVDTRVPPTTRQFPYRVFARFKDPKMLYHPATCLGRATESSFRIRFDDGIIDNDVSVNLVKTLELQSGDIVKVDRQDLRKNEYYIRQLINRVNVDQSGSVERPLTDVFGHKGIKIELKKRMNSAARDPTTTIETIDVPLSEVYLTQQLFTRLEGRVAPDMENVSLDQRLHTPINDPSRPATPQSRHRRQAAQMVKNSTIQESLSLVNSRSRLFSNMVFAVSHVLDKGFDEKKVLTEKSFTSKLIIENGGVLLTADFEELFESLGEDDAASDMETRIEGGLSISAKYAQSGFTALITNSYSRSPKFIQALALNIPCLSTRWIIDSVENKALQPWCHYLLPAGKSKLLGDVVRSRTFSEHGYPAFSAPANRLVDIVESRLSLLKGHRVIIITGKTKSEQEKRQTYVFLSYALGAEKVKRVKDVKTARSNFSSEPNAWTLIGVDEDNIERARVEIQLSNHGKTENGKPLSTTRRRKNRKDGKSGVSNAEASSNAPSIKIIGTEHLVQSLIVGRSID